MTSTPLCIYHANCMDGFTAAWIVRNALDDKLGSGIEFFEGHYQSPPPDCRGRNVIIVDFSYKRKTMEQIIDACKSLIVLDHHKTAQYDLDGLEHYNMNKPVRIHFDMNHSGAMLAWNYFYGDIFRPDFVSAVEDRDLWKFEHKGTKEIHAFMSAYEQTFDNWDAFAKMSIDDMIEGGKILLKKFDKDLNDMLKQGVFFRWVHGAYVPCCNLHGLYASEGGNRMLDICEGQMHPFSLTYFDTPNGRKFSLRSHDNGLDVQEIAAEYGGGGHRNAAGFMLAPGMWPRSDGKNHEQ